MRANSFELRVGALPDSGYKGGPKVRLKIPGRARLSQIVFDEKFRALLERIHRNPELTHQYELNTDEVSIVISYVPKRKYASASYPSYTVMYSLYENTVYQALESKYFQLISTTYSGPLGIFLCDGGSTLLARNSSDLSYSIDDIIKEFLANHREICFVVTFTVKSQKECPQLVIRSYNGLGTDRLQIDMNDLAMAMYDVLPRLEDTPHNAIHRLKSKKANIGRSKRGGMTISSGVVKISSRGLLELLAGKVDQKVFFEEHGFIPSALSRGDIIRNPFGRALDEGKMIQMISIEKCPTEDDDWLILRFEGPDPAISPFRIPSCLERSKKK